MQVRQLQCGGRAECVTSFVLNQFSSRALGLDYGLWTTDHRNGKLK